MTVHPRMRGERLSRIEAASWAIGSSPHARGTPLNLKVWPIEERFIPACAGNAGVESSRHEGQPVHPRMRGERRSECAHRDFINGSSPHARGTLRRRGARRSPARFIPACAGNATGRSRCRGR